MRFIIFSALKNIFFNYRDTEAYSDRLSIAQNLMEWGSYHDAIDVLQSIIPQSPKNYILHYHLAEAYRLSGQKDFAVLAYQNCLRLDSQDHLGVIIKLSFLGAISQPNTLPLSYIKNLFDQYAPSFEKCLLDNLDYKAPEVVYDVIQSTLPNQNYNRILDLGCGTGLSSSRFYTGHEWIEGVDISSNMLLEANKKKIFKKLHHTSVSDFLTHSNDLFDLIIALDLFIYLGKIEDCFDLIKSRLHHSAVFAFTTQVFKGDGYRLGDDGRYSHDTDYVLNCFKNVGLELLSHKSFVLRKEQGKDVMGSIFICKSIGNY